MMMIKMRRMMLLGCVVLAVLSTVRCEIREARPLNRQKRYAAAYAGGGFPWTFAGAGLPGGFFGGFPFAGGIAAPSFDYPRPSYDYPRASFVPFPFMPFPVISIPKPWYEGDNVCTEEKKMDNQQPDEFQAWMNEDFPNVFSDFSQEHESCKGSNTKYVCMKRSSDSSGQKIVATKYSCCHGFVRDPNGGPGCVESPGSSKASPIAKEEIYYGIAPDSRSSSKSSASAGSVDKVPIQ